MGADLDQQRVTTSAPSDAVGAVVASISWLEYDTAAAITDVVQSLAEYHPEVQAVILFGSVARREQRLLDDSAPSDVDLLLVITPTSDGSVAQHLTHDQELAITQTIGEVDYRHRQARAINAVFIGCDLAGWDSLFIENVTRDGLLLWARGPLPAGLASVSQSSAR